MSGEEVKLKVILLGSSGVGKSSLLGRYLGGDQQQQPATHTIGVEFRLQN